LEISDDFRKEMEIILKNWIKLLQGLDPKFLEMLKFQLDYDQRIEDLRTFLRKEVDKDIEKAFHSEFPHEQYTSNVKEKIDKITSNYHDNLLEAIEKLE